MTVVATQDFTTAVTGVDIKKGDTFPVVARTRGLFKIKLSEELVSDWFSEGTELFTIKNS